jgi:hypothetical protein
VNSISRRVSIRKQQGDVALQEHVASLCFKYFICFICMLQVFHMDVTKVDRDVAFAYVAMIVHACCKLRLCSQCFICFQTYVASVFICVLFQTYVASVLSECCICFTMVSCVFASVSEACYKCFHLSSDVHCKCYI